MARTKKGFDDSLTLISLWGFLVLALASFSSIDLSQWQNSILMLIAGAGLLLEGQILTIVKWGKNGIQGNEVPLILTILVGAFSVIVGILTLPSINIVSPQLETFKGLVAVFAFIFIAIQRWLI